MSSRNLIRVVALSALFVATVAATSAVAATGAACAIRLAGPQGLTGGAVGHENASGKCVAREEAKPKEDQELQASAQCRDLSFSYNKRKDAACAKHGGVLEWLAQQ